MKVVWVDSWRDVPCEHSSPSLAGFADTENDIIYAIRGKTNTVDLLHEKWHVIDDEGIRRKPSNYVMDEIEATLYAYEQIGRPSHILQRLRGIYNNLTFRLFNLSRQEALKTIREELFKLNVPETWIDDFQRLSGSR